MEATKLYTTKREARGAANFLNNEEARDNIEWRVLPCATGWRVIEANVRYYSFSYSFYDNEAR